jgi:hypothetical protein
MLDSVKEVRDRLRNPVNGRQSSELDIITEPEQRRRRIELIKQVATQREKSSVDQQWAAIFDRMKVEAEKRAEDQARREQEERERGILTMTLIMRVVCAWFSVSHIDMISVRRTNNIVIPRQIAMFLCRHHTTASLPQIGRKFGGRDHTTAHHAIGKITGLIEAGNEETAMHVVRLRRILGVG